VSREHLLHVAVVGHDLAAREPEQVKNRLLHWLTPCIKVSFSGSFLQVCCTCVCLWRGVQLTHHYHLQHGLMKLIRAGTEPRLKLNRGKARARSSLNSQSSEELFCRLEAGSNQARSRLEAGSKQARRSFSKILNSVKY